MTHTIGSAVGVGHPATTIDHRTVDGRAAVTNATAFDPDTCTNLTACP